MEGHFGIEFTVLSLPEEVKKKMLELRNNEIQKQPNFTMNDVIVKSVNALYTLEKTAAAMKQKEMSSGDRQRQGSDEARRLADNLRQRAVRPGGGLHNPVIDGQSKAKAGGLSDGRGGGAKAAQGEGVQQRDGVHGSGGSPSDNKQPKSS